ncbi:MAG: ATP-grasp domain-containing protein [Methanotrichaceae archaeon]|nr:ATP-grasp domain-containing protein [Methanotrichaceae archaeon]
MRSGTRAMRAYASLGLRGYAGIDFVLGDLRRVVDVNARPTTSIMGIARVMREELADLIMKARFGELPAEVAIGGRSCFGRRILRDDGPGALLL